MSEQILNVAIPWSLTHYIPLNGFHPLYRALFEEKPDWLNIAAWDNVELSQSLRGDNAFRESLLAEFAKDAAKLENVSLSPIEKDYFAHYWPANQALTRLLPGEIEVHHTAPFPSLCRPFVFHCESFAPVFFPFAHQGTGSMESQEQVRAYYKRIFENPLCLGIFSHLPETITDLSCFFASPIIDAKLHLSRIGFIGVSGGDRQSKKGLAAARFLFINSAHQNPDNFFLRGGHLVLRFWQALCAESGNERLIMRCGRPSNAMLWEYGVDLDWLSYHEGRSIIWIESYLTAGELDELMRAAHFLLLPSASLHSVSIMQAMAAGAVPIVSDTIGTNRYVVDGNDGIVLSGVYANNWRRDPESGVMTDRYARNLDLEDSLVEQMFCRVSDLLNHPNKYESLSLRAYNKAQVEFSGRAFSEDFWSKVRTIYFDYKRSACSSNALEEQGEHFNTCLICDDDWPKIISSVPQPVPRLQAGRGRVFEIGGYFVATPHSQIMNLHDWSPIAEFVDSAAPSLSFSNSLKGLNGCYMGCSIEDNGMSITRRIVKIIAKYLTPYPRLYLVASQMLRLLRAWRRQFTVNLASSSDVGLIDEGVRLVMHDVRGLNVIRSGKRFYAIPMSEGEFSSARVDKGGYSFCVTGDNLRDLLKRIDSLPVRVDQIHNVELVEEGMYGFNIIRCSDRFFAIPQCDGAFNLQRVLDNGYSQIFSGNSVNEVRAVVERSIL
ncbi:hypothetical protein RO575_05300 [Methylomonas sp. MO1]|uniref:glycosyltransferase n=1 Tax=Methylomonas sp. MO1 TaxID=3073619 RepID=UPI0028A39213|nr:hypothetical protein [Methylomonas sp. MO1]MDT4288964.1 hypothetical protein [Methylomonas sp. MO1]